MALDLSCTRDMTSGVRKLTRGELGMRVLRVVLLGIGLDRL